MSIIYSIVDANPVKQFGYIKIGSTGVPCRPHAFMNMALVSS